MAVAARASNASPQMGDTFNFRLNAAVQWSYDMNTVYIQTGIEKKHQDKTAFIYHKDYEDFQELFLVWRTIIG